MLRTSLRAQPATAAPFILVMLFSACAAPAPATPPPTDPPATDPTPTPDAAPTAAATPEPTDEPLVHVEQQVAGLHNNSVTFAGIEYSVQNAVITNQAPREYAESRPPTPTEAFHLVLAMRGHNVGQRRPSIATEDFTLVLGDEQEVVPTRMFGQAEQFYAPARGTAVDGYLAFAIEQDTDLDGAALRIGRPPDRRALLMLTDDQPEPDFPLAFDVAGEASGVGVTNRGQMRYQLLGAALHVDNPLDSANIETGVRANDDELFLVLDIRLTLESGSAEGTFARQFRLIVDGAPRGPWNSPRGSTLRAGQSVDTEVGWLIPTGLTEVTLEVGQFDDNPGTIPIELPSAP